MAQMEGPEQVRAPGPSSDAGPVGRDRELNRLVKVLDGIRADHEGVGDVPQREELSTGFGGTLIE